MIRIVADSSCDITQEEAKKLNIEIIPLPVNFENDTYLDGIDIDDKKFYSMLAEAKELPTTSQPNPLDFINRFEEVKNSDDSMLVITLSSKISGTYGSACLYKNESECDRIEIVDSLGTVSYMRMLVMEAVAKRDEGSMDVQALAEHLRNFQKRIKLIAFIDTLEYLHKGGRLSGASKVFGTLLNIKPLISIVDGEIRMINKKPGVNKAIEQLTTDFKACNIDANYPITFSYSANPDRMNTLIEKLKQDCDLGDYQTNFIGPVVGVHVGPGACAVTFVEKE
ncbi:MAG: DegV family protein [Clostridia bacterium]|nr:DegV family protein [Clostridia bacterium]